jgi:hypothetical protein
VNRCSRQCSGLQENGSALRVETCVRTCVRAETAMQHRRWTGKTCLTGLMKWTGPAPKPRTDTHPRWPPAHLICAGVLGHTDYVRPLYPRHPGRGRVDRRMTMTGMPRVESSRVESAAAKSEIPASQKGRGVKEEEGHPHAGNISQARIGTLETNATHEPLPHQSQARPGLPGQDGPQTRAPDRRAGGRAAGVCLCALYVLRRRGCRCRRGGQVR